MPEHTDGVSAIEGLYFLGLPWLRTRKPALINGINEDAAFIVEDFFKYKQQYHLNQAGR